MRKHIVQIASVVANGAPVLKVKFSEGRPMFIIPGRDMFTATFTPDGSDGLTFCQDVDDLPQIISSECRSVAVEEISGTVRMLMFELDPDFYDTFYRRIDEFAEKVYDWIKARYC